MMKFKKQTPEGRAQEFVDEVDRLCKEADKQLDGGFGEYDKAFHLMLNWYLQHITCTREEFTEMVEEHWREVIGGGQAPGGGKNPA